jgi:hypothetical protein
MKARASGARVARLLVSVLVFTLASLAGRRAHADPITFGPHDVATVFFIAKSNDRDRVDYGIRLDANCLPVDEAAFAYWRDFDGANSTVTHSLSWLQRMAYGISSQAAVAHSAAGVDYRIQLKQFAQPIDIFIRRDSKGTCLATPRMKIAGVAGARLLSVYLQLDGPASIKYVDIHGLNPATSAALFERILNEPPKRGH